MNRKMLNRVWAAVDLALFALWMGCFVWPVVELLKEDKP